MRRLDRRAVGAWLHSIAMPRINVIFYKESSGCVPVLDWLEDLPRAAQNKCLERIERLTCLGHELRRPHAENLGSGIWELRVKYQGDNYRILFFYHGRTVAVLGAGFLKKQRRVPQDEIDRVSELKKRCEANPDRHTYEEEGS